MAQQEIEVILMRQLASCLATPIFLIDRDGNLLFFNEPAEAILGRRFDETGTLLRDELYEIFQPADLDGAALKREENPLFVARSERHPAHRRFRILGMDGVSRTIEATAFPLVGQSGRNVGAVGIFWEIEAA
jgi:PAS domain-containing protein